MASFAKTRHCASSGQAHQALVRIDALRHVAAVRHPRAVIVPAVPDHDARDAGAVPQNEAQLPLRRPLAQLRVLQEGAQVVPRDVQRVASAARRGMLITSNLSTQTSIQKHVVNHNAGRQCSTPARRNAHGCFAQGRTQTQVECLNVTMPTQCLHRTSLRSAPT